jgi:hypothetical protein
VTQGDSLDVLAEFRAQLRQLYEAAGRATYRQLESLADREGRTLARATAQDLISGTGRPRWTTVEAFVIACAAHVRARRMDLPPEMLDLMGWRLSYEAMESTLREARRRADQTAGARGPTPANSRRWRRVVPDPLGRIDYPPAKLLVPVRNPVGHAFISYVREDSLHVDQLQRRLEAASVPVWRDTADLWPGEDWRTKIRQAITDDTLVFIACFSQQSLRREKSYQNEELTLAIEQLRLRRPNDPWLIPVRFDAIDIPDRDIGAGRTLASIQRADLFGDRFGEEINRLVAAVLQILDRS